MEESTAMAYPRLKRAPIVEGLLHFQVKSRPDISIEDVARFTSAVKQQYPIQKDLRTFQAAFKMDEGEMSSKTIASEHIGYRLERSQPPFVLIAQRSEIGISRLAPYETWEQLIAEARPLWDTYRNICGPEAVTRIATRFINRVELPMEGLDFDHYLAAPASLPKGLPELISSFFVRTVVTDPKSGSSIAVSQILEAPNLEKNRVPILIDIDVYKVVDFAPDSDEIWKLFDTMRDLKNCAFFGCLTSKALEMFE